MNRGLSRAGVLLVAAPATALHVTFDAFVDGYHGYEFDRPASFGRASTTRPAGDDERSVNVADVEVVVAGPRVRGRLAVQAGTSVQARVGFVSGSEFARLRQEAHAGYRVTHSLRVAGGIFHTGMFMGSRIPAQNPTYTRSLVADFPPYSSAGIHAIWQATPTITARDHHGGVASFPDRDAPAGVCGVAFIS